MADIIESRLIDSIKVEAVVQYGHTRITVANLIDLGIGDTLFLDQDMRQHLELVIAGEVIARGVLLQAGQQRLLRLTAVATADGFIEAPEAEPEQTSTPPQAAVLEEVAVPEEVDKGEQAAHPDRAASEPAVEQATDEPASAEEPNTAERLAALTALPHGDVLVILGRFAWEEGEALFGGLQSKSARAEMTEWLKDGLTPRIERYESLAAAGGAQDADTLHAEWIEPDLITALDKLAELHSMACTDAFVGHEQALAVAQRVESILYDELSGATDGHGWFQLQRIIPYQTEFDPAAHKAAGPAIRVKGAKDKIVKVAGVGLVPSDGGEPTPAQVYMGR
jgi:hypothetical protein